MDSILTYGNLTSDEELEELRKSCIMAGKIARNNFDWRFTTIIYLLSYNLSPFLWFLKEIERPAVIATAAVNYDFQNKVKQYAFFTPGSREAIFIIKHIASITSINVGAKFIISCAQRDKCDETLTFRSLARLSIFNVVFLRLGQEKEAPFGIFSFRRFTPNNCENYMPFALNLSLNCRNDHCFRSLYTENHLNFHQCSLDVSTLGEPPLFYFKPNSTPKGIHGELITVIAKGLNAQLRIKLPKYGADCGHFSDGSWTGLLGDLNKEKSEIVACGSPLTFAKYGNFQTTQPFTEGNMVWVTKATELKPAWEKLLYPFDLYLRIGLILIFILIICLNAFIKSNICSKFRKFLKFTPNRSVLFYSWVILLGNPVLKLTKRPNLLIVIYCWIWFCFLLRSAYQAALITCLKFPYYRDDIASIHEIFNSGRSFGGSHTLREFYTDDPDIYKRWFVLNLTESLKVLDKIIQGESDFTLAIGKHHVGYHDKLYKGAKNYYIIAKKVVNAPMVLYLRNQSSLVRPIDRIIRNVLESGLMDHFRKKNVHFQNLKKFQRHNKSLSWNEFQGAVMIWCTGVLFSIIYFIVEIASTHLS